MRLEGESGAPRASALLGKGFTGDLRSSALWAKGGRGFFAFLAIGAALALAAPAAAGGGCGKDLGAYVPTTLVTEACADKRRRFNVIVQGRLGEPSSRVASEVDERRGAVARRFRSITASPSRAAWSRAAWSRAAWSRANFDSEPAMSSATSNSATGVE
jgi:hypothetical protein